MWWHSAIVLNLSYLLGCKLIYSFTTNIKILRKFIKNVKYNLYDVNLLQTHFCCFYVQILFTSISCQPNPSHRISSTLLVDLRFLSSTAFLSEFIYSNSFSNIFYFNLNTEQLRQSEVRQAQNWYKKMHKYCLFRTCFHFL